MTGAAPRRSFSSTTRLQQMDSQTTARVGARPLARNRGSTGLCFPLVAVVRWRELSERLEGESRRAWVPGGA